MSLLLHYVRLLEIFGDFKKCGRRNKIAEQLLKTVFQVAMSLLNAHYPIFFIVLFQHSCQVLIMRKYEKTFEHTNTCIIFTQFKILIFADFSR